MNLITSVLGFLVLTFLITSKGSQQTIKRGFQTKYYKLAIPTGADNQVERFYRGHLHLADRTYMDRLIKKAMKEFRIISLLYKKFVDTRTSISATSIDNCRDPTDQEFDESLSLLLYLFSDIAGIMDIYDIKKLFADMIVNDTMTTDNEIKVQENLKWACYDNDTYINYYDFKPCPSYTVISVREDVRPSMVHKEKCSCTKCLRFNATDDAIYRCEPIKVMKMALKRTSNCLNGVFFWAPVLEEIPVACICKRIPN